MGWGHGERFTTFSVLSLQVGLSSSNIFFMLLRLFQPIKFPVWPLLGVLIVPSWAIGQAEQQAKTLTQMPIRVTGANDALTQNVLAWLTEPIACDADELQRQLWQRLAGKATTKALQALG